MALNNTNIYVYADWVGMIEPKLIGILTAQQAKGKKAFSFEYDAIWLKTEQKFLLDPDISLFTGSQYPNQKENFGIFLDSMPDTWGRTLMKRRAAQWAKENNTKTPTLYDIDFLLGVFDESRMGALRFKTDPNGAFLDNNKTASTPPWSSIRELQNAAENIENDKDNDEIRKWLSILIAPGSSLGGARPKANILDTDKSLWIAKFPSKSDTIDKAAWEYLAYKLAIQAGIDMAPCKIEKIMGTYNTFFTKRFDRENGKRIHFASAMTMTGNNEETIKENHPSYLEIAEFISNYGVAIEENLHQLWRRIVFNIAISNTDDHLRNHGFILTNEGWILSPAYDLNPSIDKDGLSLNIDMDNYALDFEIAISVGAYFRLNKNQMVSIIEEVKSAVSKWEEVANKIGISRSEQQIMGNAFNY
ncbi:toxin HipA [Flavobacterium branchiophilum]|uniref:Serine/threonine-protein kinase HipA n=1 Tax=Flavobacterium branchiophilum TaxID=55197 RepID=A0A543G858_9FLAO|nr:HipA domain-containing protein [Flavobacterium branchiophilum]OXA76874.1 toxin HipA [Flavobacterium branchiophilum] [Flavobacterium branchiophilum NBRC 15030 = ATCC 35035]TQM42267.1 serine/threonine-protein kinase HipA [Flavobacterium branchiophilum]GEM56740.1 toxin HipA [Flavobacterium branchiophilum NBRC 15030 = ATCC 35035]